MLYFDRPNLSEIADFPTSPNYIDRVECEEQGDHLTSTDEDGFCNFCGEQD